MMPRAVIFDVYKTLLQVGPAPGTAGEGWQALWQSAFARNPRLTLDEFIEGCRVRIDQEHRRARACGIPHPEVYWPEIAAAVLPELGRMDVAGRDRFLLRHAQLVRSVQLAPFAGPLLRTLHSSNVLLGIASNAQPYTLHELDEALGTAGLSRSVFHPELCFWSFKAGFGKPDPHVFRWLTAAGRGLGIEPGEFLMVGDRLDNDIAPAGAQGWKTWHFAPEPAGSECGDLKALAASLGIAL